MKKMTFLGFVSHERLQLFAGIDLYFRYRRPSVTFCSGDVFADGALKGNISYVDD